jgi:predicted acetyltransferase
MVPIVTNDSVQLIEPDIGWKDEFLAFWQETESAFHEEMTDFYAYVQKRIDYKAGRNLPAGWVPGTEYWLIKGNRVLGTSSLRHRLTPALEEFGGHIGYVIRPSERRKGYGTEILRLTLQKAAQMQLRQVVITCDDVNLASARIIEVNGGRLKDIIWNESLKRFTRRYWIHLNHIPNNHLRTAVTDLRNHKKG